MKKYSVWAILLALVGTFFSLAPFTSISGALQQLYIVIIGLVCLLSSLVLITLSFLKKEKGILKFIPLVLLLPIFYFILNFRNIMGGV
ncbi:hypothetical protein [[Bacillus] enclensis]|uniref:hypothetical protein n=1 Tax=[Bacillus] enclensis TaxID=1402860 RepID=UPI0018DC4A74|nr:hypothetical protein [[Bacillus] enclensis]MBH9968974.1 hypothetical protein [[Bacillus] enclensis]